MLGNHPFAWFITFAFFCEVFKEHKQAFGTSVPYDRLVSIEMLTSLFSWQPKLLEEQCEEYLYYHICQISSTGMIWYSLKTKQCKCD